MNPDLFQVDSETGLLHPARQVPSPNCDARPADSPIDLAVIHAISLPPGEFGGSWIEDLFTNRLDPQAHPYFAEIHSLRVSAHVLIRRDGEVIQFVPFHRRAWHAGRSAYEGRANCNDYSIGIELEGCDERPYSAVQYRHLAAVLRAIAATHPAIAAPRIVGHCHIAPDRKTDPGPHFEWDRLHGLL